MQILGQKFLFVGKEQNITKAKIGPYPKLAQGGTFWPIRCFVKVTQFLQIEALLEPPSKRNIVAKGVNPGKAFYFFSSLIFRMNWEFRDGVLFSWEVWSDM